MVTNHKPVFWVHCALRERLAESVAFYAKAFGYSVRRLDESHRWGEMETGNTTIAFTPIHQYETDDLTGAVYNPRSCRERPPMEVCFVYSDVDAAYKNGAVAVSEPELKEWEQKVGYVRDIDNGKSCEPTHISIRLGGHSSNWEIMLLCLCLCLGINKNHCEMCIYSTINQLLPGTFS